MPDLKASAERLAALAERMVALLDARERELEDVRAERDRLAAALAEADSAREADAALRAEAAEALDAAIGELRAAAEDKERETHG
jgi:hypothetical protein